MGLQKRLDKFGEDFAHLRTTFLLASLLLLYCYTPLTHNAGLIWHVILALFSTVTVFASIYTVAQNRTAFNILLYPAVAAFLLQIFEAIQPGDNNWRAIIADLTMALVYTGTAIIVLRHSLTGKRIDADKLVGAICAYFLFALIFGRLYEVVEAVQPGSFIDVHSNHAMSYADLSYFSLITLTSVGYGDITPVSIGARTLASLEGAVGVLFLAIFVARMVGQYRTPEGKK